MRPSTCRLKACLADIMAAGAQSTCPAVSRCMRRAVVRPAWMNSRDCAARSSESSHLQQSSQQGHRQVLSEACTMKASTAIQLGGSGDSSFRSNVCYLERSSHVVCRRWGRDVCYLLKPGACNKDCISCSTGNVQSLMLRLGMLQLKGHFSRSINQPKHSTWCFVL